MKLLALAVLALAGVSDAFMTGTCAPKVRGGLSSLQMAHHVINKGAKKSAKNRPKKACPSDINRKPPAYNVDPMIAARATTPEFSVIGTADMSKMFKVEKECGKVFYHTKAPHAS